MADGSIDTTYSFQVTPDRPADERLLARQGGQPGGFKVHCPALFNFYKERQHPSYGSTVPLTPTQAGEQVYASALHSIPSAKLPPHLQQLVSHKQPLSLRSSALHCSYSLFRITWGSVLPNMAAKYEVLEYEVTGVPAYNGSPHVKQKAPGGPYPSVASIVPDKAVPFGSDRDVALLVASVPTDWHMGDHFVVPKHCDFVAGGVSSNTPVVVFGHAAVPSEEQANRLYGLESNAFMALYGQVYLAFHVGVAPGDIIAQDRHILKHRCPTLPGMSGGGIVLLENENFLVGLQISGCLGTDKEGSQHSFAISVDCPHFVLPYVHDVYTT